MWRTCFNFDWTLLKASDTYFKYSLEKGVNVVYWNLANIFQNFNDVSLVPESNPIIRSLNLLQVVKSNYSMSGAVLFPMATVKPVLNWKFLKCGILQSPVSLSLNATSWIELI